MKLFKIRLVTWGQKQGLVKNFNERSLVQTPLQAICMGVSISWVNFINVLRSVCMSREPKSAKRQPSHQCLFALLGFTHVKADRKTLVKLTPGWSQVLFPDASIDRWSFDVWKIKRKILNLIYVRHYYYSIIAHS